MLENRGEMEASDFDDANVPVDIWLTKLKDDDEEYAEGFRFKLTIGNYMPRKGACSEGAVEALSDNREELQKLLEDHVLPLYKVALAKIEGIIAGTKENLYYWDAE